jgi:hypothetical protein
VRRKQKSEPICVDEDKSMGNAVTIIVGAGAILNLDPHISFSDFSVPYALSLADTFDEIQ